MKKIFIITVMIIIPIMTIAQSNLENVVKGSELLLTGLTILKVAKANPKTDSKVVPAVCVKNKLAETITFRISGLDSDQNDIKKELVIPKDGKECLLEFPKGIYTYEFVKANNEIYKKGEYKLEEEITIIVKDQ